MLSKLDPSAIDPRVGSVDERKLRASDACILNVDYPLGMAAYHILRQVAEQASWVAGVYVLGKAATLNADVGDVMIPNVVHNEHSGNTYWLDNCFAAADVQPNLVYGSALDNQRAVAVRGTFLQNRDYLDFYYQGRYTVVEMEAGPYLDACYEIAQPDRYPLGESVNMARINFDLGIVHYASDTPYTQARTLGARGLSYRGMDSTYASAIAVARRILQREEVLSGCRHKLEALTARLASDYPELNTAWSCGWLCSPAPWWISPHGWQLSTWIVVCPIANLPHNRRSRSRTTCSASPSGHSPTTTWQLSAVSSDDRAQTCRSCMLVTSSAAGDLFGHGGKVDLAGVPSMSRFTVSRTILQAPKAMRTAMPSDSSGSI